MIIFSKIDNERGVVAIEFALIMVFFLIPLLIGIIDWAQILDAQTVVARAAEEGAVAASKNKDYVSVVNLYMKNAGFKTELITIIDPDQNAVSGDLITVSVKYNTSDMVIIPWKGISPNLAFVSSSATHRKY